MTIWCRWHYHFNCHPCSGRRCRQAQLLCAQERCALLHCRGYSGQDELRLCTANARAASADASRVTGQRSIRRDIGINYCSGGRRIIAHITAKNLHHHTLHRYLQRPIQVGYPEQRQMQCNHSQADAGPGAVGRKRMGRKQRPCHTDMFPQLVGLLNIEASWHLSVCA